MAFVRQIAILMLTGTEQVSPIHCRSIVEDSDSAWIGVLSLSFFFKPIPPHLKDLCVPPNSCTASHDTVSFSDGRRSLHNTSIHKSVYAAKINSVKSKSLFAKMPLMLFQGLIFLSFLLRWVKSYNGLRLLHSLHWINILRKHAHLSGGKTESI